ncbi:hypothetical protein FG152_18155 [Ochrobactrum sp. XJ1]|nr:hypothetical protein [Ochrobactrum sp. XJ1]
MVPLQMTPYEKVERLKKAAIRVGVAGFGAALIYAVANGGFPESALRVTDHKQLGTIKTDAPEKIPAKVETVISVEKPSEARSQDVIPHVKSPTQAVLRDSLAPSRKTVSTTRTEVQRFDRCVPACDTRDPQVANRSAMERIPSVRMSLDEVPSVQEQETLASDRSIVGRGRDLLGRVADVPDTTLTMGRRAIQFAVNAIR